MFSITECDLRYAAHTERVARIDRSGWQSATVVASRPRTQAKVGALIARAGRLAGSTRRAGRVAASPAGRGVV